MIRRTRPRIRAYAVACALIAAVAFSYAPAALARPKICLVLSGGGARGAAHIGVLKVLEEMRVPIDCIAGTSMGSLVGGAYATGMTVSEMERLIEGVSMRSLISEKPPRQDQAIRRKLDDRTILSALEVGVSDDLDVTLPKGIVTGVGLETILRRLSKVQGYRSFDALPVPFRAVATDLETGKAVVFSQGELPNVMRASMSIPGAIAPAERDGRMLVDGMLTDNLPVDVARAMGADVIIAVNLGTPLAKRDQIKSLLGVTGQMVSILTKQNVERALASLTPADVLIEPELGDFSATDFDHMPKTVPIGEAAARAQASRLAALAVAEPEYAAWHDRLAQAPPADTRPVAEIRFEPLHRVNAETLIAMLETKPDAPLDLDTLDRDIRRLFGTGDFEHVNYRILEEAGRRVLDIDAVEKSWGPNYLRFGPGLGSDFRGNSFFNLAASYRRTWINSLGAEWRTDVQAGRTSRIATEFYQPLETRRYFFVAPRAEFERRAYDLFQGSNRIARYNLGTAQAALDVGMEMTKYGEARLGVLVGSLSARLDTGPPALEPPGARSLGAATLRLVYDQLDSANFPRSGSAASVHVFASTKALGGEDAYTKWDADWTGAYSLGRHTLQAAVKAGGALSGSLPRYDLLQWGGFLQQSGYPMGALLGERLTFGRFVYTYKLREQRFFEGLYAGVSLEAGRMEEPLVPGSPTGTLKSLAVFFGVDSPLGPVYLGYGRATDGNRSAYFFLGRP
ncbi:MAG: patatin-like phospholipase family protein [Acidobacteriota bacterium]